jgi:tetratricopeptide (TPR) repeat protein
MTNYAYEDEDLKKGAFLFANKEYEKSLERFSSFISKDPELQIGYLSRGAANIQLERFHDAIGDLDEAEALDQKNPKVYHLRGIAYSKLGKHEEALENIDRAIAINPEYGSAFLSRANIHSELGHEKEASEDMEMAALLEEKNIQTFADGNNVWRTRHLKMEAEGIASEMER